MLEVNKNSIVFRLARHLCSSTPLVIAFTFNSSVYVRVLAYKTLGRACVNQSVSVITSLDKT